AARRFPNAALAAVTWASLGGTTLARTGERMADRVFGDPARHHPVAWFGTAADRLEKRIWADSKPRGAVYAAVLVGGPTAIAALAARRFPNAALAAVTWASLGGTTLARTGERMADRLEAEDLAAARELVP
ncbi:hypothetical protein HN289_22160, partial [Acinetobacter baumannii]|nr:hypothetical protein [Acinetobacter baumannii]